jgi:hypothetical protein
MPPTSPTGRTPLTIAAAFLLLSSACTSFPESISCQSLRALEIGMTDVEARAIVGSPQGTASLSECGRSAVAATGECWFFESSTMAKDTTVELVLLDRRL